MTRPRTAALLAVVGALGAAALPAASAGAADVVCNEAQSSWQGTWDATASGDAVPPAFHKDAAMPVGAGGGLRIAAERSAALAACIAPDGGGGT